MPEAAYKPNATLFWARVDKTETCWIWTGAVGNNGYGRVGRGDKTFQAHRFAYEREVGQILPGLHSHHLCGNRLCVRPEHLVFITQTEHNRVHFTKTHCPQGHAFEPDAVTKDGKKYCRTCARNRQRAKRRTCACGRPMWHTSSTCRECYLEAHAQ